MCCLKVTNPLKSRWSGLPTFMVSQFDHFPSGIAGPP